MTDAHDQKETLNILCHIPQHEPRSHDPNYHLFNEAKRRIKAAGLYKCAIDACPYPNEQLELHHSKIEFSLQGGVDIDKFNKLYGLHIADEEEFKQFIEQEGNLEVLCAVHHRTHLGVHALPEPFWNAVRVWKADMAPPAEHISKD